MKSSLEQEFALHLPKGNKPWFEGWYVRVQTKEISFAIIFGLQISNAHLFSFLTRIRRKAAMWNIHGRL